MISAAVNEKKEFVNRYLSLICNTLDILLLLLFVIPAFGNGEDAPEAVSLFGLTGIRSWIKILFEVMIGVTVLNGVCGVMITFFEKPVWNRHRLVTGMSLSIIDVFVFMMARQPYAGVLCFALLVIKGFLMIKVK